MAFSTRATRVAALLFLVLFVVQHCQAVSVAAEGADASAANRKLLRGEGRTGGSGTRADGSGVKRAGAIVNVVGDSLKASGLTRAGNIVNTVGNGLKSLGDAIGKKH